MGSVAWHGRKLKSCIGPDGVSHGLMPASVVQDACRAVGHRWRDCYWRPTVVILTFLRQVLHGCSCRQAVAQTVMNSAAGDAGIGAAGEGWVSGDPSAYSQARQKLPPSVLRELNRRLTERLQPSGADRHWCGRRVRVVDGSSVSLCDAPPLQKAYPHAFALEDLAPVAEGQVTGDQQAGPLIAIGEDLEEQFGAGAAERPLRRRPGD